MQKSLIKVASVTALVTVFAVGTASAGEGKNCDHKKTAAAKTQTTAVIATPQMTVLSDAQNSTATKTARKTYSFEDALRICQEKGAADLQACVDYKTGVSPNKS